MDDQKWLKDIDRKMADYEASPPKNLWEDIEKSLEKDAIIKHRAQNIVPKAVKWAAAAVLAGAVVLGGSLWVDKGQGEGAQRPMVAAHGTHARAHSSCQEADEAKTIGDAMPAPLVAIAGRPGRQAVASVLPDGEPATMGEDEGAPAANTSDAHHEERQEAITPGKGDNAQREHDTRPGAPASWQSGPLSAVRNAAASRVSLSLTASNFLNATNRQDGYGELVAGTVWKDDVSLGGDNPGDGDAMEGVILGNKGNDVYTKKKHRQPVKVGLSVNYQINRRLSVGTGLVYSYLSSDLVSGTDNYNYSTKQTLQYVGVPLTLSYALFQGRHWSVYGTGGGMAEKCVKGNSTTDYVVNGKVENTQRDKVGESRLQYSVNAAVGVQVKMTGNVGVYVEPGISYHFDNHSDVTNIYKDTPLNFSLGMGIRYSF